MKNFKYQNNLDLIRNFTNFETNAERYSLIVKNFYLSVSDPDDGVHISELGDLTNLKSLQKIKEKMNSTEEGKSIILEMPRINEESLNMEILSNFSKNTLGYRYYCYMKKNYFSPNERPIAKYIPDIELSYICQRYKETHDFYHSLLDLDKSLMDEVALKWFEAEHLGLSSASYGGIFGILTLKPTEIFNLYNKILPGIIYIARSSKLLLGVYFEKRLEQDIDDLRKELNIDLTKLKRI